MNAWDHYQFQEARAQKIGLDKLRACLPEDFYRNVPRRTNRLAHLHGPVSLLATMAQAGGGPEGHLWSAVDTVALLEHVVRYHVLKDAPPPKAEPASPLTSLEAEEARQMVDRVLGGRAKNYHARHLYHVALTLARYARHLEAGKA